MSSLDTMLDRLGAPVGGRSVILPIVVGLLVCAGLIASYFAYLDHPYVIAFSGLRSADAASVVETLDNKKIPYKLKDGGGTILVPDNLADEAKLDVVDDDPSTKGLVGFELFNKSDMGTTEFAQRINYQRALQGELSRTIMSLDGVQAARVHLSLPEATIFRDDRRPPKASVTILPRRGAVLSGRAVEGVRRLVAAAVPDLDAKDVVVLDERGVAIADADAPVAENLIGPEAAVNGPVPDVFQASTSSTPRYPRSSASAALNPTTVGMIVGTAVLALGLFLAACFASLRASQGASLSRRQKETYVSRLKRLVSEVDADAASRT